MTDVEPEPLTWPPLPEGRRAVVRLLFPSWVVALALLVVAVVLPAVLVVGQIEQNPKLSQYDEFAHLDYMVKVTRVTIPSTGEFVDPLTLRIMACAKIDYPRVHLPPCDAKRLRVDQFPGSAYNHEAQQPPLYYAITGAMRSAATRLGVSDYLTAARLTGVVWLAFGMLLLWCAGRLLGAPEWPLLAAMLVLAVSPGVIYFSAIVSNDATAIGAGAGVLFLAAMFGRRHSWPSALVLGAGGFVAAFLKPTNIFAVATVALVLLYLEWRAATSPSPKPVAAAWLRTGGALLLGGAVAAVGWVGVSGMLATVDARTLPIFVARGLPGFHPDLFAAQASGLLEAATGTAASGSLHRPIQVFTSELIAVLFITATAIGLFVRPRSWYHVMGLVAALVLVGGGFLLGLSIWVSLKMDPGVVPRYGLSVLPLLTVCIALVARRGRTAWVVGAVGCVTALTTLSVLL